MGSITIGGGRMSQANKKPWEADYSTQEVQQQEEKKKKPWESEYVTKEELPKRVEDTQQDNNIKDSYGDAWDYTRAAGQGLTLGFADEIEAGVRSVYQEESYDDIVKTIRDENAEFVEKNPAAALSMELVGGIPHFFIPGVGWVKAGSALSKGAKYANTAKNLGKLGAEGAGYGAVYGAGTADSGLENTVEGAGEGALVGGLMAPVLGGTVAKVADSVNSIGMSSVAKNKIKQAEEFIKKDGVDNKTKIVIDGKETDMTVGDYQEFKNQTTIAKQVNEKGGRLGIQSILEGVNKDGGDRISSALSIVPTKAERFSVMIGDVLGKDKLELIGLREGGLSNKRIKAINGIIKDSSERVSLMGKAFNRNENDALKTWMKANRLKEEDANMDTFAKFNKDKNKQLELSKEIGKTLDDIGSNIKKGDITAADEGSKKLEDLLQESKATNIIEKEAMDEAYNYNRYLKALRKLSAKSSKEEVNQTLGNIIPLVSLAGVGAAGGPLAAAGVLGARLATSKANSKGIGKGVKNLSEALDGVTDEGVVKQQIIPKLASKEPLFEKGKQASKEEPTTSWVGGELFSTINKMSVDGFTVDEKKGLKVAIKDAYSELTTKEKAKLVPLMTRLSIDIASGGGK